MQANQPYRLLGIDPGTNVLGYAVIEIRQKKIFLMEMGVVTMQHLSSHQQKLQHIFEKIQLLIQRFEPIEMAIEAPFYGKNIQSMLKLGRAQGVAIAAAMTKQLEVSEYAPKKIKQSVCGNGNASKEQVAAMLSNILQHPVEAKSLDATDALATAVCHFYQSNSPLGTGKKHKDWSSFLRDNPSRKG